ncbi:BQ5605_C007g04710 [Microbotryum silenes-dioicae]|uniref:BQ5605_C007g04710 protein n=1 Tax=Microbotryum silenes-dioicae TaxID=796604 RepID=A0A2X0M7T8_9BASI|nr:BQ5605_C007g04710 [Microbotryum silenes-dioicae]
MDQPFLVSPRSAGESRVIPLASIFELGCSLARKGMTRFYGHCNEVVDLRFQSCSLSQPKMPAVLFDRAMPLNAGSSPTAPLDVSTTPKTSATLSTHSSPVHISEHTRKIITAVLASTLLVMLLAVVGTVVYQRFWKQRVSAKRGACAEKQHNNQRLQLKQSFLIPTLAPNQVKTHWRCPLR